MAIQLGVDVGTTGTKVAAITHDGRILASAYREYGCSYPRPNWVEQDPDELVRAVVDAMAEVASTMRADDIAQVGGLAVSAQRCCLILLDAAGVPTRPMISWQDNRPTEEAAKLSADIGPERFFGVTGLPPGTTWLITKLLWVRGHEPEVFARSVRAVQLHDYVLSALGAHGYYSDIPDAVFWGAWNTSRRVRTDELFQLVQLDESILPEFAQPGTRVGALSAEVADRTGLRAGVPLVVGAGDQNAAAVGAGIVAPGQVSVSLGTGGMAICAQDHYRTADDQAVMTTNHVKEDLWQLEGYQAGAASVYRWFRDELGERERTDAKAAGDDVYDRLNALASSAPPGAHGLITLPYWASATAPRWNPMARGAFVGLSFAHDRAALARSVLEGITMEMRDNLEAIERTGGKISDVRILGGPTRSAFWNQIQADIYGKPVTTLASPDAAVIGAATIAAVGTGEYPSIDDAAAAMVRVGPTYDPDPSTSAIYDDVFAAFRAAYEGLAGSGYDEIASLQEQLSRQKED